MSERCTCERKEHFEERSEADTGSNHTYGMAQGLRDVKTAFGTFTLCRLCLEAGHYRDEEITP